MSNLSRFKRLALPHMGTAFNLAFGLSRSRPDAEDIVQEAYLRALRSFGGFRGEDLRPWLLAIVRNAAYRWLAARQRAGNVVSLEETLSGHGADSLRPHEAASDEPSAEQRLVDAAERDCVLRALAELPPAFREAPARRSEPPCHGSRAGAANCARPSRAREG